MWAFQTVAHYPPTGANISFQGVCTYSSVVPTSPYPIPLPRANVNSLQLPLSSSANLIYKKLVNLRDNGHASSPTYSCFWCFRLHAPRPIFFLASYFGLYKTLLRKTKLSTVKVKFSLFNKFHNFVSYI